MRVIVVGAGLAGLSAAESFVAAGIDVVLIEAGHRLGGRTRTVHDRFFQGQFAESGAEWVDSTHIRLHELMERFGVEICGPGQQWSTIRRWLYWLGNLHLDKDISVLESGIIEAIERYEKTVDATAGDMPDAAHPTTHPSAKYLDSLSLADVLRECDLQPAASLLAQRSSQGEFAEDPQRVSLLFVAQQRAQENVQLEAQKLPMLSYRVKGGVSQIGQLLYQQMAQSSLLSLRMNERLIAIEQTGSGVLVDTRSSLGDFRYQAEAVVLATSLVPLRSIDFRTPMPEALYAAVHGLGYGAVTKTAVQFAQRVWEPGYGTTDTIAQRLYDCSLDQGGEAGILMAYCGGDGGRRLAMLDEDQRIATIVADMRQIHHIKTPMLGAFSRAWGREPNFGGAYAIYEPGQVTAYWDVLRQPWGRVHLAGEHVATCTGYMEGAIESGRDVAERIVCTS